MLERDVQYNTGPLSKTPGVLKHAAFALERAHMGFVYRSISSMLHNMPTIAAAAVTDYCCHYGISVYYSFIKAAPLSQV